MVGALTLHFQSWRDVSGNICYFNEGTFLRGDPSSCSSEVMSHLISRGGIYEGSQKIVPVAVWKKRIFCLVSKFQGTLWVSVLSHISGPKCLKMVFLKKHLSHLFSQLIFMLEEQKHLGKNPDLSCHNSSMEGLNCYNYMLTWKHPSIQYVPLVPLWRVMREWGVEPIPKALS